jgi:hypothetical protein
MTKLHLIESESMHVPRKTVLAVAVAAALMLTEGSARAQTFEMDFTGVFTMINPTGAALDNQNVPAYASLYPFYLYRTPFKGRLTYDDVAKTGQVLNMTGTVDASAQGRPNGFYFFGTTQPPTEPNNLAQPHGASTNPANPADSANLGDPIPFTNIGNGGTTHPNNNLLLANLVFSWSGGNHFVPIVWDATGMLANLQCGPTVSGAGVLPASDGLNFGTSTTPIFAPMGQAPIATTTWNTTSIGDPSNTFPFAGLPLTDDGIGGSPMTSPGFGNHNANFDILTITMTKVGANSCDLPPPAVQGTAPSDNATGVLENTSPTVSFNVALDAATITAPGSVVITKVATNTPVSATVSLADPQTILIDPATSLEFSTEYRVDLSTAVKNTDGDPLASPFSFTFTTRAVPVDTQVCVAADQRPDDPVGSNFTMLNGEGSVVGGTNDVSYALDFANLNTTVNGTTGIQTNVLTSASDFPFFGFAWTAHHIRLFGPGTYSMNTGCTRTELENGTLPANCALQGPIISMTVGANQIGAHMLFDWNQGSAKDIDVLNVWDKNKAWTDPDETEAKNDLFIGEKWAGPAGLGVDPDAVYQYVSTDNNGDGEVGIPMGPGGLNGAPPDSPFAGFNANFNLGADRSCLPIPPESQQAPETAISDSPFGCSLNSAKVSPWQRADLGVLASFIGLLAFWRRRNRTSN